MFIEDLWNIKDSLELTGDIEFNSKEENYEYNGRLLIKDSYLYNFKLKNGSSKPYSFKKKAFIYSTPAGTILKEEDLIIYHNGYKRTPIAGRLVIYNTFNKQQERHKFVNLIPYGNFKENKINGTYILSINYWLIEWIKEKLGI